MKPFAFKTEPTRASAMDIDYPAAGNPVREQVEALASGLGAELPPSEAEAYILGGADTPQIEEPETVLMPDPAPVKRGWSLFGRKRANKDLRKEPPMAVWKPAPERVVDPPSVRPDRHPIRKVSSQRSSPTRRWPIRKWAATTCSPTTSVTRNFEIPAFLRRQSN